VWHPASVNLEGSPIRLSGHPFAWLPLNAIDETGCQKISARDLAFRVPIAHNGRDKPVISQAWPPRLPFSFDQE